MKFKTIPVTHYAQNCSLIWCEETKLAALIDPGGDVATLLSHIDAEGLTLSKILLTHGHLDHVGGTAEIQKQAQVVIEGPHKDDLFWIQALVDQAGMMGFTQVDSFTPDRWLNHGDEIELGNVRLSVIHCPGHTPGHVVFHHKDSGWAFVGDVLFNGSIGRTDFPKGDFDQLVNSIKENLWPLGDHVKFVPGHGPNSDFGHERQTNPFVADKRFG